MSALFRVELERAGDEAVVRMHGELDHAAAGSARDAVEAALRDGPALLSVDLGGLRFMDSTGIWLLVDTQRRCLEAGREMRLVGPQGPGVARTLEVSGVDELIPREDVSTPSPERPRIALRLYLSGRSSAGAAAADAASALVDHLAGADVELEIIDVVTHPGRAGDDRVIATPTLVRVEPGPPLRLIGSLADPATMARHLGLESLTVQRA